jgi:hypothetical protein
MTRHEERGAEVLVAHQASVVLQTVRGEPLASERLPPNPTVAETPPQLGERPLQHVGALDIVFRKEGWPVSAARQRPTRTPTSEALRVSAIKCVLRDAFTVRSQS